MTSCELSANGKRIEVRFPYSREAVASIKSVNGARFVGPNKGGPYWTIPADLTSAKELRRAFPELQLGPRVRAWGNEQKAKRAEMATLAVSDTGTVSRLPEVNRKLFEAVHLGPKGKTMTDDEKAAALAGPGSYQAADVAFGAAQDGFLNANHMGLGKTIEAIATVYEAGLENGPQLVIAPVVSLEATWAAELTSWQNRLVFIATGTKAEKRQVISAFRDYVNAEGSSGAWLITNPETVRYTAIKSPCEYHVRDGKKPSAKTMQQCPDCEYEEVLEYPELFEVRYNSVIVDEAHASGLMNGTTLTGKAMKALSLADKSKRIVMSGTPMKGKEIKMFGFLQFIFPQVFTSKWRWAGQWLEITDNGFGKVIGGLKRCEEHWGAPTRLPHGTCEICDAIERDFWEHLTPYIVRRTKADVLPWLPAKQHVDLWCDFGSGKHREQYMAFLEDAEVAINDSTVTASNVLAEYTRLRQFSFGRHELVGGKLVPTEDSGKLKMLEEKLTELDIFDEDGTEQVLIFSQFREVVDLVHAWLVKKGVKAEKITGGTNKKGERARLQREFQGSDVRALVITTQAGGVSLTLDMANTVFILDEMWDPDSQEQAEDRAHRASRIHQVTVYYLRTSNTIEEFIAMLNDDKDLRNRSLLDLRRVLLDHG